MKIEIFKSTSGQWYFHIIATNGEIVASSEGYRNKTDCLKTAKFLRFKLIFAKIVEI